jgi:hypothetical protein
VDDEKGAAERIENTVKVVDEVSRDFGRNPKGLARLFAHGCVLLLPNIRDIRFVALLALSENRDSASRASLCYGLLIFVIDNH